MTRIFKISFSTVYPLYLQKVEKKGRTQAELDQIIQWLTGYDAGGLATALADERDFETFFTGAPEMNPNRHLITGSVCGRRVEEIEEPLLRDIRYLDKLVDELLKGKEMGVILRGDTLACRVS